jgi:hypothetical protein
MTSSEMLAPPQTNAIELPRLTLPIIGTDQTPLADGVSTLLAWTWPMASIALNPGYPHQWRSIVVETASLGSRSYGRDGCLHI